MLGIEQTFRIDNFVFRMCFTWSGPRCVIYWGSVPIWLVAGARGLPLLLYLKRIPLCYLHRVSSNLTRCWCPRVASALSEADPIVLSTEGQFQSDALLVPEGCLCFIWSGPNCVIYRGSIPIWRVAGARGMPLRPHPQPVQVLAIRPLEHHRWRRLQKPTLDPEGLRYAPAVRYWRLLRRWVCLLPQDLQRWAGRATTRRLA